MMTRSGAVCSRMDATSNAGGEVDWALGETKGQTSIAAVDNTCAQRVIVLVPSDLSLGTVSKPAFAIGC